MSHINTIDVSQVSYDSIKANKHCGGTSNVVLFSGTSIASIDGKKTISLTSVHDSITGNYGITSITASNEFIPACASATVNATGGITDAITIDWRLYVSGAIHQSSVSW